MRRLSRLLVVGVCLAMLVGPAAAASATVAIDAPSTVESGETVTVSLTVTNTGESENAYLLNVSAPDSWSVVDHSDDGGEFDSDDSKWIYTSVDAGASVQPSVTFDTAGDTGTAEITATAENSSGLRDSATHSITVESESDDGGGSEGDDSGSSDDGSSGYGGGSSSDDGSSSGDSDTSSDDTYGSDATDTPSDGYGSSSDDAEYTASGSDTDDTGSSTPSSDGGDSVSTAAAPDDGSSSDSGSDSDQSGTDSLLVQSGLGIALLGMTVLALAGLTVLLVQRK